jgi:uncharacterized YigZ family protein
MVTRYKTIAATSSGEYKEKGSRFIGCAFPVTNPEEAKAALSEIKKEHPKARHHCFAFRTGVDGTSYRANDDGEPSGTAGKPILNQIDSFGLTNVLVVVVRYFGGVLLGASGLNHAYKSAARLALEAAMIVERDVTFDFELTFDADKLPVVMNLLKKQNISTKALRFENNYTMEVSVGAVIRETLLSQLSELNVSTKPL